MERNVFGAAKTTAASATSTSNAIRLADFGDNLIGSFSLQGVVTGDGTCTISWTASNDGTNFVAPTHETTQIAAAIVKTSGPGSDGKDIWQVTMISPYKHIKIVVVETGTTDSIITNLTIEVV